MKDQLNVRLDPSLVERVKKKAKEEGRTVGALVGTALEAWLESASNQGRDKEIACGAGYLDADDAQGIRRRIQRRAIAGDDQAQAIVDKLATGELSPNAAAIAAGMREQYIRISPSPSKAAKGLFTRKGQEWCLQLLEELSELVL